MRSSKLRTSLAFVVFLTATIGLPAWSDTLTLRNGTTLSGTLAGANGTTITFQDHRGQTMRYAVRDVEAVQFGDAPYRSNQNGDYSRPSSDNRNTQSYGDPGNRAGNANTQGYENNRNRSGNATAHPQTILRCLDTGAGSTDRNVHYTFAHEHATQIKGNLMSKMDTLFRCPTMQVNQLTDTFATISVIVPRYIANAGCFGGDVGPLNTNRSEHKNWADSQRQEAVLKNLQSKTGRTLDCLDPSKQADFFADVSVALAQAAYQ